MGTLAKMPWREDRKKIYGPGVYDMKSGVMMALTAVGGAAGFEGAAGAGAVAAGE